MSNLRNRTTLDPFVVEEEEEEEEEKDENEQDEG